MWACLFFVPPQLETRAEENKRTQFKSLLEYWTFCSSWNSMRIEFGGRLCSLYMTPSFLAIRWPKCITNIYTTPVICHFAKIQSQKYIKCQKLNTTIQKKKHTQKMNQKKNYCSESTLWTQQSNKHIRKIELMNHANNITSQPKRIWNFSFHIYRYRERNTQQMNNFSFYSELSAIFEKNSFALFVPSLYSIRKDR